MSSDEVLNEAEEILEELNENLPNEQVEKLLSVLQTQNYMLRLYRARHRRAENRLKRIEAHLGITDLDLLKEIDETKFDSRDQEVLRVLAEKQPEKISLRYLKGVYKRKTDIRQEQTLRDRIKFLIDEGPFENIGPGTWRYTGRD